MELTYTRQAELGQIWSRNLKLISTWPVNNNTLQFIHNQNNRIQSPFITVIQGVYQQSFKSTTVKHLGPKMNHSPDSDGCLYNKSAGYGYDDFNERKWEGFGFIRRGNLRTPNPS